MSGHPELFEEVIEALRHEWATSSGESEYLRALEELAIRLTEIGPVASRFNETASASSDALVRQYLAELRDEYRQSIRGCGATE